MLDLIIYLLFTRTYVFMGLLFAIKIFLLLTSEHSSRSLLKFFYYNHMNLILTSNPKKYRYKKIQNNTTIAILFLVLIQGISLGILYSVLNNS